jgi:hypothetical protein
VGVVFVHCWQMIISFLLEQELIIIIIIKNGTNLREEESVERERKAQEARADPRENISRGQYIAIFLLQYLYCEHQYIAIYLLVAVKYCNILVVNYIILQYIASKLYNIAIYL